MLTGQNNNIKSRILAVDDNPDITITIKLGLEASGTFEVHTFNDPEVALSHFKPGLYDLALLDMRMPKMYGHELYDKMKKLDGRLKVCFMTATRPVVNLNRFITIVGLYFYNERGLV